MHLGEYKREVSEQSPISEKDNQRPNRRMKAHEVQPKYVKTAVGATPQPSSEGGRSICLESPDANRKIVETATPLPH